jgi:hypothetical protein
MLKKKKDAGELDAACPLHLDQQKELTLLRLAHSALSPPSSRPTNERPFLEKPALPGAA